MTYKLSLLLCFGYVCVYTQVLSPNNPYIQNINKHLLPQSLGGSNAYKNQLDFKEISATFDQYWKAKDHTPKGSGYKPFKRWEYHWAHYLDENGMIAPPDHLWKAWHEKIKLEDPIHSDQLSDWHPLGPAAVNNASTAINGQGRINTVLVDPIDPNTLYVGAPAGGIWKSTDNGIHWTPLSDYLPQIGVSGIAVDPNNNDIIYISTGDDDAGNSYSIGVMKSTNGGTTWNSTGLQFDHLFQGSNEILIDPTNSSVIWVATTDGLQKSTDAGATWTNTLHRNIQDFKLKPGDSNTVYAVSPQSISTGDSSQFFKSVDGGESFTQIASIPDNSNRLIIEVTPADPNRVYVLTAGDAFGIDYGFQGLYQSSNSGSSFTKTQESDDIFGGSSQAWFDMALTVSDSDPDMVFVGVLDIWKSIDGGNDFSKINDWRHKNSTFTHADIHFLRYYNGVLYAGTDGGVYRSFDDGTVFEDLTSGLSIAQLYSVAVAKTSSNKIAGGLQDCGGYAYNIDQWNSYHGGDGMGSAIHPKDENLFYGMTQLGGHLFRNNSAGVHPTQYVAAGPKMGEWVTPFLMSKSGEIYAGYDQLYMRKDNLWEKISNESFDGNIDHIELDPSKNNIIYVSNENRLFKSSDHGLNFSLIYTANSDIQSIEVHETESDTLWLVSSSQVLKSINGGESFIDINYNLPSETKRVIKHQAYSPNDAVFLGTSLGVYYLDNTSTQWKPFSENLPNVAITDLEINSNDNMLTASTYGRGIWQTEIPSVVLPAHDIDLYKLSVESLYSCNETLLSIDLFNNGTNPIHTFRVEYTINNENPQFYDWSGTLHPKTSLNVLINDASALMSKNNLLNLTLHLENEQYLNNNEAYVLFDASSNQEGIINNPYVFDQESNNWITKGTENIWNIGTPDHQNQIETTSAYITFMNGQYPNNAKEELVSPCFDLTQLTHPILKFDMLFDLENNYDFLFLQYSVNSGVNWVNLEDFTGTASLTHYEYDLTALNDVKNIIFRFYLVTDISIQRQGALIDNFEVSSTLGNATQVTSLFRVFPNPSKGRLHVNFNPTHNSKSILVYDVWGRIVHENNSINSHYYQIDLSKYQKGTYLIRIEIENQPFFKKIILL